MITDVGDVPTAAGGRVRGGVLFRLSGALAGPDELRELEAAGLRRVVDLRGDAEDRSAVEAWARIAGVEYIRQPILAGNPERLVRAIRESKSPEEALEHMRVLYLGIVDQYGPAIAATIEAMAVDFPAGYGCAAGKDRTGVVSALLHVVLGVSDDEVARRYVNGAPAPDRLRPMARLWLGLEESAPLPPGVDVFLGTREETIMATLDHVRWRYGGVEEYLEEHGLTPGGVAKLRSRLVA